MKKLISAILALLFCFMTVACGAANEPITQPNLESTDQEVQVGETTAPEESSATETEFTDTETEEESGTAAEETSETAAPEEIPAEPDPVLLAGFGETDFTPAQNGYMPGSSYLSKASKAPEGKLLACAAAFTCGDTSLILISMDMLFFSKEFGREMRTRISEKTGVPVENIMVGATHTHTGPALEFQFYQCPAEPETARNTLEKGIEAALTAWENRGEAALGVGKIQDNTYAFCRDWLLTSGNVVMNPGSSSLVKAMGVPDRGIDVMRVEDAEGNLQALIVNYANHPDSMPGKSQYSADYPGYMRRYLKAAYGEDVTILYFNGAQGDINFLDFKNKTHLSYYGSGKNAAKAIGEGIAQRVMEVNKTIVADNTSPFIDTVVEVHQTVRRRLTEEQYRWALSKKDDPNLKGLDKAYVLDYLVPVDHLPDTVDMEIHVIRFGPWAIVGLPGEIYSEIGHRIKANSPYECTLVLSVVNEYHGYICPDNILDTTVYEAHYHSLKACTGHGTADVLVNGSVRMLEQLKEKEQSLLK